jgi:hypothetical protein
MTELTHNERLRIEALSIMAKAGTYRGADAETLGEAERLVEYISMGRISRGLAHPARAKL